MKCVSTLGLVAVGVAAACLFASPTGAQDAQATPPAKNLSLDRLAKQVEALQATLNALKAEIEQHAGTPKAAETKGRDLGRHGMMGPADADRGERRGPRGADERGERRPAEQVDRDGEAAADELPRGKEASGRMFDLADRDGDGLLSKEEFSAARRAMSHRMGRRFGRMHRPDRGSQDRMGRKSGRGDMRRLGRGPHGMTHPDDRDGGMRRFGRGPRGIRGVAGGGCSFRDVYGVTAHDGSGGRYADPGHR